MQIITARGIALDRLSRHAEAQETYRRGLAIDPTNFVLMSNLGLSLGLSGQTGEGITILRELVRDGAATANTRGNLALVYGLAGREREASATLAVDLSPSQIQNNLAYYRTLREMLRQGKPIGNLDAPGRSRRRSRAATRSARPRRRRRRGAEPRRQAPRPRRRRARRAARRSSRSACWSRRRRWRRGRRPRRRPDDRGDRRGGDRGGRGGAVFQSRRRLPRRRPAPTPARAGAQ